MIVDIDTKPPILLLSAEPGQGGQVTARWEITDPHLKPDTLSLQYRTSNNGPWQPIAVDREGFHITDTTQSGEVTWWPTPGTQDVVLRAEVSDSAGNKASAMRKSNSAPTAVPRRSADTSEKILAKRRLRPSECEGPFRRRIANTVTQSTILQRRFRADEQPVPCLPPAQTKSRGWSTPRSSSWITICNRSARRA